MELTRETLAAIPYLGLHGVDLLEAGDGAARVRLPDRPELRNHVGTVHAGALFTAAEAAGGVAAATTIDPGAVVLLREARVSYRAPGEGEVVAQGRVEGPAAESAREAYARSRRGELQARVSVLDAAGTVLVDGTCDYAVREARR